MHALASLTRICHVLNRTVAQHNIRLKPRFRPVAGCRGVLNATAAAGNALETSGNALKCPCLEQQPGIREPSQCSDANQLLWVDPRNAPCTSTWETTCPCYLSTM